MPRFARRPPRTERTPAAEMCPAHKRYPPRRRDMRTTARRTPAEICTRILCPAYTAKRMPPKCAASCAAYAIPPPRFAPPRAAVLRVSVRSFAANPQRSFSDIAPTLLALRAKTDRYLPPCRSVSLRCATVAARTAGYCGYVAADGNFRTNTPAALPSFAYTLPYTATKVNPFSRNGRRLSKF